MTDPTDTAQTVRTIADDTPCRKCSYNLRGLSEMGRCPECGTPAGVSIHGALLCYSDPQWLARVVLGVRLVLWGILAAIVVSIVGNVLMSVAHLNSPVFAHLLGLAAGSLGVVGTWMMTEPDPSGIGESESINARKIVRIAVAVGVGYDLVKMLIAIAQDSMVVPSGVQLISLPLGFAAIAGEYAKLTYVRGLALRIPDLAIAEKAKKIRTGYCVSMAVVMLAVAVPLVGSVMNPGRATGAMASAACVAGLVGIAMIVYAIRAIILLYNMRNAIGTQMTMSRGIWAQQVEPQQ